MKKAILILSVLAMLAFSTPAMADALVPPPPEMPSYCQQIQAIEARQGDFSFNTPVCAIAVYLDLSYHYQENEYVVFIQDGERSGVNVSGIGSTSLTVSSPDVGAVVFYSGDPIELSFQFYLPFIDRPRPPFELFTP